MLDQGWPLNLERTGPVWSWFDPDCYGLSDPVAARASRQSPAAALEDYEDRGAALGYRPNRYFDPAYYLSRNPHVAAGILAGDFRCAFDHYRVLGWRDRDPHWLFNTSRYGAAYADLAAEAVDAIGGLYGHYLQDGAREGRTAHRFFDANWYSRRLPARLDDSENPFGHYLDALEASASSAREPQGTPYFDPAWYVATYPDVAKVVAEQRSGALFHYLSTGVPEGRDPLCDFSEAAYRADNTDVDAAVEQGHFRNGYEHFLEFGAVGLRSPSQDVELRWYAAQPSVARDLSTGRFENAFFHLLEVGIPGGLPLKPALPDDFAPDEAGARGAFLAQARRMLPEYGRRPLNFSYEGEAELSVIVVLRNQFALTMQGLASLRHTFAGAIQLLVVDNGSSDETREIADVVLGAHLVRLEDNIGFLRACNLVLKDATAPIVLYLNNDVVLHADAVRLGMERLQRDATVGAVGGKIIRTHGLLQEAGCLLWRDGSAEGWMRGAPPDAPEANFVRDVDFCSGAFLMVQSALVRELGGFDEAYAPAYYEEVDLCLRIQAAGFRVVYDPAISLTHYEYGSSRSVRAATALMATNRATLRTRNPAALRARSSDRQLRFEAASVATAGRRVLFIEDTIPLHRLGSGYPRSADTLGALIAAGWQATVYPMHPVRTPRHKIAAALPETVEIMWDRDHRSLDAFIEQRRGCFDLVWVSRAHNLRLLLDVVNRSGLGFGKAKLVLDTEAVFSLRDAAWARLEGLPFSLDASLRREFDGAWLCDHVVAVNEAEAAVLRRLSLSSVGVAGMPAWRGSESMDVAPMVPTPWAQRRGLLHVGAMTAEHSPNCEGLRWYLDAVYPHLVKLVDKRACRLSLVGHVDAELDLDWLRNHPGINFVGPVNLLKPLFGTHRAFVAPTRFGAGLPTKVLDAAAFGLPTACTALLAGQLGWTHDQELLAADGGDGAAFAENIARLLTDEETWTRVRVAAQRTVEAQFSPRRFASQVADAVVATGVMPPRTKKNGADAQD